MQRKRNQSKFGNKKGIHVRNTEENDLKSTGDLHRTLEEGSRKVPGRSLLLTTYSYFKLFNDALT